MRRNRRPYRLTAAALGAAILSVAAAACGSGGSSATSQSVQSGSTSSAATTVRVELTPVPQCLLQYVAQEEGFFTANGIKVQDVSISTTAIAMSALASNSVDIINAPPEVVLSAIAKGLNIQALSVDTAAPWVIMANDTVKQVPGSLDAKLTALKGLTFGVSALGSGTYYVTRAVMNTVGLTYPQDYSIAAVGSSQTALPSIETNHVQLIINGQPTVDQLIAAHKGYVVANVGAAGTAVPPNRNVLWATASWVSAHPAVAKGVARAMAQAYVWLHDSAHLAATEKLMENLVGASSIPSGYLASMTQAQIAASQPWLSASDLQQSDEFDLKSTLISSLVPAASLLAPSLPASQSAATALASS
jgi:ABC-type nitrate/sulfonate/bicarbonate transport system substrate-binding protein